MPSLAFDVRYTDGAGDGVQVDPGISVVLYEDAEGLSNVKETRTLGTQQLSSIVELTDDKGYLYRTVVDVTEYAKAKVKAEWTAKVSGTSLQLYTEVLDYPGFAAVFTESYVKDYVFSMLGHPTVHVELTPGQMNQITGETLRVYNRYVAREERVAVKLVSGQYEYSIPQVTDRGVADVEFMRAEGLPYISDPVFGREFARAQPINFDTFILGIGHWKELLRVTSQEPDWEWDQKTRMLRISPGSQDLLQSDLWIVSVSFYSSVGIQEVPENHHDVFLQYALGRAKVVLGEMREKFGGSIPGPGGGLTMNASALKTEGNEQLREMERRMENIGFAGVVPRFG